MKRLLLVAVLALTGCAPYKVAVYGKSGSAYTAPTLCGALVACLNSTENSCFYDRSLVQTATGNTASDECKEVKK